MGRAFAAGTPPTAPDCEGRQAGADRPAGRDAAMIAGMAENVRGGKRETPAQATWLLAGAVAACAVVASVLLPQ
jgi:hypothetical protein